MLKGFNEVDLNIIPGDESGTVFIWKLCVGLFFSGWFGLVSMLPKLYAVQLKLSIFYLDISVTKECGEPLIACYSNSQ